MFKKIILLAVFSLAIFMPAFVLVQAQTCPPGKTGLQCAGTILGETAGGTGLQDNLGSSIATIIKTVLALVGTIFLILTIYAGVLWMTAQGEESKVEKAKEIIKASIIGLIIIMSAYAITAFVTSKLAASTQISPPTGGTP